MKRQFAYYNMLWVFGLFSNFAIYNSIFTGIYIVRNTEILNTRRIPFAAKLFVSSAAAFYMCNKLWDNNIYEAELYEVALRYREKYDKSVMPAPQTQAPLSSEVGASVLGGE